MYKKRKKFVYYLDRILRQCGIYKKNCYVFYLYSNQKGMLGVLIREEGISDYLSLDRGRDQLLLFIVVIIVYIYIVILGKCWLDGDSLCEYF